MLKRMLLSLALTLTGFTGDPVTDVPAPACQHFHRGSELLPLAALICVNIRAFYSTKFATSLTVTSLSCLSVMVSATSRHFWRRLKECLDTIFFKLSGFSILLR